MLLELWHAHRAELLLLLGALVLAVRVQIWRRDSHGHTDDLQPPEIQLQPPVQTGKTEKPWTAASEKPAPQCTSTVLRRIDGPKRIKGVRTNPNLPRGTITPADQSSARQVRPVILYYSLGGSTAQSAADLRERLVQTATNGAASISEAEIHDIAELDFDAFFVTPHATEAGELPYYLFLLPTYNIDSELDTFIQSLEETHNDFRIDTAPLRTIAGYSVFGYGDREGWQTEQQGFCSQAKDVDKWMARLSAGKRAYPIGLGDIRADVTQALKEWTDGNVEVMRSIAQGQGLGEGVPGSGAALESDEEEIASEDSDSAPSKLRTSKKRKRIAPAADLEDIRGLATTEDLEIDFTTSTSTPYIAPPKEMVPKSSTTYTALTKQGYTIVGSHSGVKICRWTKSALRGRGSCYKYSFYGIASHRCMEATPSLSCSNKCVFCWRHGTNPVSTTWRWTVDPPELVFAGIKAGHYGKIKSLRGVPGVRSERFSEALAIRHCALSLVGEPIFYPHINALLAMLHAERISSFLVCNAQHPQQLRDLAKVTQLYVSIDAPTKSRLKKVDRPLHRDFWERFLECMDILRARRLEQRTVFRLTLVKGFNLDDGEGREDVLGYADLVERARPAFVEVKGVTFCGTATAGGAGLTMQNVPFYREVCAFVEALDAELARRGLGYGVAVEHAHSCCILLAERERFWKEDGWHTLIDYERFFERLESGEAFEPADYVGARTPEWALYGNGGFDPRDQRVDRKGRIKEDVEVDRGEGRAIVVEI